MNLLPLKSGESEPPNEQIAEASSSVSTLPLPLLFEKLPVEMIEEIFKKLSQVQLQKNRQVNRLWNMVISDLFPLKLELNVNNWRTIIKSEAQLIYVVIPGMDMKFDLGRQVQDFEAFCVRIRKVEFSGLTQAENILAILLKCKSVKKLTLNKACPVKKRDYISSVSDIVGFGSFPQNLDVPQDFLSMLTSFHFNLDGNNWRDNLDLFEAVSKMLYMEKLKKLKIHSFRGDGRFGWYDSDGGKVLEVVHGMTNAENSMRGGDDRYQNLLTTLITRHKPTLEKLKIARYEYNANSDDDFGQSELLALEFYPREYGQDGFRAKTFRGRKSFYGYRNGNPGVLGPWLHYLLRQDGLKTLDLNFNDSTAKLFIPDYQIIYEDEEDYQDPPNPMIPINAMYTLLPQILLKNTATLTTVNLTYHYMIMAKTDSASINFSDGFPNCVNLKSLTVMKTHDRYSIDSPSCTGISQLPPSLKFLATNFSIRSGVKNITQLELGNLKNLETLVYSAHPPFLFEGKEPVTQMNKRDFKILRSKLPGLKKFLWGIGEYQLILVKDIRKSVWRFRPFKTPTLTMEVRKLARRTLEYRKKYGPLYELKLRNLN